MSTCLSPLARRLGGGEGSGVREAWEQPGSELPFDFLFFLSPLRRTPSLHARP